MLLTLTSPALPVPPPDSSPTVSPVPAVCPLPPARLTLSRTHVGRVWSDFSEPGARSPSCVTSWSVLDSGIKPSSAGSGRSQSLVVTWVQSSGRLVAGEQKQLHVWDLQSERRLAELPLGTDAAVTTLASNDNGRRRRRDGGGLDRARLMQSREMVYGCDASVSSRGSEWQHFAVIKYIKQYFTMLLNA